MFGQFFYLVCNNCKSLSGLASTRCFDRSVQGEEGGLKRELFDRSNDPDDVFARVVEGARPALLLGFVVTIIANPNIIICVTKSMGFTLSLGLFIVFNGEYLEIDLRSY